MRRIGNYTEAQEYFKNTKAVRGENQSVRRLGNRYEKEKWLRQEIQDGVEVYVAGYYRTDLVRYYPTHKEITLGGYPSLSTEYFVSYMGGYTLFPFEHKKYVPAPFTRSPMVKNSEIECSAWIDNSNCYMNAYDWYAIGYDNKPLNPEQFEKPVKYRFDASQMRELRKPYKKLLKYADTMLKLDSGDGVEPNNETDKQLPEVKNSENILHMLADEDKTYLSYYYACRQTQRRFWINGNTYGYKLNIGMIKRWLDKMIKLENPQVLVEVN
jgi:uncharacterized protein YifE (UPF0438 family)